MAAPAFKTAGLDMPELNVGVLGLTLIGDTPLIVHAWSLKAKREMLDKQLKKAKSAREAKDPKKDFEESMYRLPDGGHGFPSIAFKTAAVTAVTSVSGITKISARQSFHVMGEGVDVHGAFPGTTMQIDLARIETGKPRMREDLVRIGLGTADLRYRAEFWPWRAMVLIKFNANVLSEEQIANLFNTAGFAVGVGEWRPERDGQNGMFRVATDKDLAPKKKRRGKK